MPSWEQLAFDDLDKRSDIHVVGVTGVEGAAVASFLLQEGFRRVVGHALCREEEFERALLKSHDLKTVEEKQVLLTSVRGWGIDIRLGERYLEGVESADLVFVPQSWELYPEENTKLFPLRAKLRNIMHLYLELAPCKTIGVTGSDGKTTTAHLIAHLLKHAGFSVALSGNYRQEAQVLSSLHRLDPNGFLVLEISNRHLNFGLTRCPDVAVITNVTQNHLTEYAHFESYRDTKERILGTHTLAVLNADNPFTFHMGDHCKRRLLFSRLRGNGLSGATLSGDHLVMNGEVLCDRSDIALPGEHNVENVLAAVTVVRALGVPPEVIREGVRAFTAVPERLQFLAEIGGRRIVNDLSATSAESARCGILSFAEPVSIVLGGSTKGVDYAPIAETIREKKTRVFGVASEVTEALQAQGVLLHVFPDAESALSAAYENTPAGGVILLSPAGAFFASRFLPNGVGALISSLRSRVGQSGQET